MRRFALLGACCISSRIARVMTVFPIVTQVFDEGHPRVAGWLAAGCLVAGWLGWLATVVRGEGQRKRRSPYPPARHGFVRQGRHRLHHNVTVVTMKLLRHRCSPLRLPRTRLWGLPPHGWDSLPGRARTTQSWCVCIVSPQLPRPPAQRPEAPSGVRRCQVVGTCWPSTT